jgi:hypothetical protein
MANLEIPKDYYSAVTEIINLNDTQRSSLLEVFQSLPLSLDQGKLIADSLVDFEGIGIQDGEKIFSFVASLYSLLQDVNEGVLSEQLIQDIIDAINLEPSLPSLEDQDAQNFFGFLVNLLTSSKSLYIAAKAVRIITEHEHLFLESRILTDVRFIFNEVENEPSESVIIHNLKLTYRKNDEKKDLFVALDNSDLAKLSQQIARAIQKTEAIENVLEKAEILNLKIS